jgi:phosphoribosylglycinamide formyltransferase-1
MIRLGVLGSTRGTLMLSIIQAISQQALNANISIVISNKSDALILENAKKHGLDAVFIDPLNTTRETYDDKLSNNLMEHQVDLVVLVGYMRILSKKFVETWANKIINVHPSLLPAFAGLMDKQVHQAVLDAGVKETGCTVHYVTEDVDAGPVVIQQKCDVLANDSVDQLKARVQALEGVALVAAINKIIKG